MEKNRQIGIDEPDMMLWDIKKDETLLWKARKDSMYEINFSYICATFWMIKQLVYRKTKNSINGD